MSYTLNSSTDNCYEGTTCLINKLDIRDEKILNEIEADITFAKASLLEKEPIKGSFDFDHYKAIHHFLFLDLFDWAGQIRTVNISKKGTSFVSHEKIEKIGKLCLSKISNGYLDNISHGEFAKRIAELYHDMNMLHPFREGNGRTQRIFFAQLIRYYGYDIDFSEIDFDYLMFATIRAANGVMDFLNEVFLDAIKTR
ncbi:MAG: Fic family protein [Clostridia bacterium]|nr:Fic family protein [Clostridia bacterium]MBO5440278.1 Fic family protein [Clostridia bacterium]